MLAPRTPWYPPFLCLQSLLLRSTPQADPICTSHIWDWCWGIELHQIILLQSVLWGWGDGLVRTQNPRVSRQSQLGSPKLEQTQCGQVQRCCRHQSSPDRHRPWLAHPPKKCGLCSCMYNLMPIAGLLSMFLRLGQTVLLSEVGVSIPNLDSPTVVSCHLKNHKVH